MEGEIDQEVQRIVDDANAVCKTTLTENRNLIDLMTERLLEKENIDYDELARMTQEHLSMSPEERANEIQVGENAVIA